MTLDKKKRNKRIADWQKERRIVILVKDKEEKAAIQAAADKAADQAGASLNAYILAAIREKMEGKE